MAVLPEAKTYWVTAATAVDTFITANKYTDAAIKAVLPKIPSRYPTAAHACITPETPEPWLVAIALNFTTCTRALTYMVNGTGYVSRESMELRCKNCRRFAACPTTVSTAKKKYCILTLQVLGNEFRSKSA